MSARIGSRRWTALCYFVVVSMMSYGARVVAGDAERFCNGGNEFTETWGGNPVVQCVIYFKSASALTSGPYVPGGRNTTCGAGAINEPGFQSLIQAIATWNSATIPGTTILGSSFSFAFPTTTWMSSNAAIFPNAVTQDTVNEVDLFPLKSWFRTNGFSGAMSITNVNVTTNGHILGADVVVNTTQHQQGNPAIPLWSFLEYNTHPTMSQWIVTDAPANLTNPTAPTPLFGFVDLLGDITHELGHAAGLGHAVLDGSANSTGSGFPTMFPFAQVEPFSRTVTKYVGCVAQFTGNVTSASMGTSAQTLEYDDVVALSRQYGSSGFNTLGKITGTVTDSVGAPVLGAAVVAVSANPMSVPQRIQTLTYAGGNYALEGLTAGNYYVYIEPIDQDPNGNSNPQYYFANVNDVPNYVDLVFGTGCMAYVPFQTEFYNVTSGAGDQSWEVQCAATAITLTTLSSGSVSTATGVNLVTSANPDILSVGVVLGGVSPAYHSARGVRFALPAGGAGSRVVEFVIHGGLALQNKQFQLEFSEMRVTSVVTTAVHPPQLDQIIQSSNPSYPPSLGGQLDANGDTVVQVTFGPALQYENVFVQAKVGPAPGGESYSNCVNVWVGQ